MAFTQKELDARHRQKLKDNGLCVKCGKVMDRQGCYCVECLSTENERAREDRKFYRSIGICPMCRKTKLWGQEKVCIECSAKKYAYQRQHPPTEAQKMKYRERFNKTQKELYAERVEKKICTRCGKQKAKAGRKKCGLCLMKDAEIQQARRKDQPNIRKYRAEHNLCYFCGGIKDINEKVCPTCKERCSKNGQISKLKFV